jgi:dsRNA-specific ribonuclease
MKIVARHFLHRKPNVRMAGMQRRIDAILHRFNPGLKVRNVAPYECVLNVGSPEWERLEFLGDAVIGLAAAHFAFQTYPEKDEGQLSKQRTRLVKGTTLVRMCRFCHVNRLIDTDMVASNSDRLLEDLFEAFVGGVYLDHGFDAAAHWFAQAAREFEHTDPEDDATMLAKLERVLKRKCDVTTRRVGQQYYCVVHADGWTVGSGANPQEHAAKAAACRDALSRFIRPNRVATPTETTLESRDRPT